MFDHDDDETSWREDLHVEVVRQFLTDIVRAAGAAELDMTHIVVCHDSETGTVSYSGPFPDGISALVYAERESAVDCELNEGAPLSFGVAALYPPDCADAS